jgi:hypothetical protein
MIGGATRASVRGHAQPSASASSRRRASRRADPQTGDHHDRGWGRAHVGCGSRGRRGGGERHRAGGQAGPGIRRRGPRHGVLPSSYARGAFPTDLGTILPSTVLRALNRGLPAMDCRFQRLFLPNAMLTGSETRGSSPVRGSSAMTGRGRARASRACTLAARAPGMHAGRIVSTAVDGLRTARVIVAAYTCPSG